MVRNRSDFGRLVASSRGSATKQAVDDQGGPTAPRLTQVENGDPVEITPGVLDQIDTALNWGSGTSAELLSSAVPPSALPWKELHSKALGFDRSGNQVPMPPLLVAPDITSVMPVIARWRGPVLVDVQDRWYVGDWLTFGGDIEPDRWLRTGLDEPEFAEPVALDPFPNFRSSQQLSLMLERFAQFQKQPVQPSYKYAQMALTLLYITYQHTARPAEKVGPRDITGLDVLDDLVRWGSNEVNLASWGDFFQRTRLSNLFNSVDMDAVTLFEPLLRLRDFHVSVSLTESDEPPKGLHFQGDDPQPTRLKVLSNTAFRAVTADDLNGKVLFYDGEACPVIPFLVDQAYRYRDASPLLVSIGTHLDDLPDLPGSRKLVINEASGLSTAHTKRRELRCETLVESRSGTAIYIPAPNRGKQSRRVWLNESCSTASNRYHAERSTDATTRFFQQSRGIFGVFTTAEVTQLGKTDQVHRIVLTDDANRNLDLWHLPLTSPEGREAAADLLSQAGFGNKRQLTADILTFLKESPNDGVGLRLRRQSPAFVLPLGTSTSDGTDVGIDLGSPDTRYGQVHGEPANTVEILTGALTRMCANHSTSELAILGFTTNSPRPWAPVADLPHMIGFIGPGIGARDNMAVLRWFDDQLNKILDNPAALSNTQGGFVQRPGQLTEKTPTLLIVLDGVEPIFHELPWKTSLRRAVSSYDFDIRFLFGNSRQLHNNYLQSLEAGQPDAPKSLQFSYNIADGGTDADQMRYAALRLGDMRSSKGFRPWADLPVSVTQEQT